MKNEWKPIETAPKDESLVDLWCVNDRLGQARRFAGAYWHKDEEDWYSPTEGNYAQNIGLRPTHWMLMPAPPMEAQ